MRGVGPCCCWIAGFVQPVQQVPKPIKGLSGRPLTGSIMRLMLRLAMASIAGPLGRSLKVRASRHPIRRAGAWGRPRASSRGSVWTSAVGRGWRRPPHRAAMSRASKAPQHLSWLSRSRCWRPGSAGARCSPDAAPVRLRRSARTRPRWRAHPSRRIITRRCCRSSSADWRHCVAWRRPSACLHSCFLRSPSPQPAPTMVSASASAQAVH